MLKPLLPQRSRRPAVIGIAIVLSVLLTGCVVAPVGPGYYAHGWCYYHPYRC